MSSNSFSITFDSQHRNKNQFPNPYNFTMTYADEITNTTLSNSVNPISDSYISKEWSWNSTPHVQIITSGDDTNANPVLGNYDVSLGGHGGIQNPNLGAVIDTGSSSGNIKYQYRVDNQSNGSGLTFNIITRPNVVNNKLLSGELKICTYGSNYIPGETLKIHRSDMNLGNSITRGNKAQLTYNIGSFGGAGTATLPDIRAFSLVPILMTKGSGYLGGTSYTTTGGSGSGMKIILTITTYQNDELITPVIDSTHAEGIKISTADAATYTYKEGDILTLVGGSGKLTVMLVDIRFRVGQSFSIDISNIVKTNTIFHNSVTYHHANLHPLHTVTETSGNGSGMILATIDEPVSQDSATTNVLLLNQIAYIFEIGTGYEIGDTITITDRSNNKHVLTLIESGNTISNKNNITTIYDSEILTETKYTEPILGMRTVITSVNNSDATYYGSNIFNSPTEPNADLLRLFANNSGNNYVPTDPLDRVDFENASVFSLETLSSIRNINGNKVFLHNSRFFGLNLYDNYFKGLIFHNITSGEQRRITHFDSKNSVLTLESDLENSTIQDIWKIENPSNDKSIFIPNGSDNDREYVGQFYECILYTGNIFSLTDFITETDVNINNINTRQYKLNNKSFDKRFAHQFRKIVHYDNVSKMITLESPIKELSTHANKFGSETTNFISSVKYIHEGQRGYLQDSPSSGYGPLPVFPVGTQGGLGTYATTTNTNASGLFVNIIVSNGGINSIDDIIIIERGSGYETQDPTGFLSTLNYNQGYTHYTP